jgi:hypothetical protein
MIELLKLDLSGLRVVTEAATGAYVVTPVIAAAAGAEVTALAKESRYGSVSQVRNQTRRLAREMGVDGNITIVESLGDHDWQAADVITNSGHLRPLHAGIIERLKPAAVIALMYEAWELRTTDLDVEACRKRGVRVTGTNERHQDVGIFDYLGLVVVKAMLEAHHSLIDEDCLLLCDNAFGPAVQRILEANGVRVTVDDGFKTTHTTHWDTIVVACTPVNSGGSRVFLDGLQADLYCQLWGDVDRTSVAGTWLPEAEPKEGHMGLTLQSLGPTPIVKLQTAGLKSAEVVLRGAAGRFADIAQCVVGPENQSELAPVRI